MKRNRSYKLIYRPYAGLFFTFCVDVNDNGSRELLVKILTDEEHHVDWLEAQLHAINEMGIQNYLAQQIRS